MPSGSHPPIERQRARILVIDDDAMWRYLTSDALRERGFDVEEADTAQDVMERLAAWQPDLLIIDALMPDVDGFTACRLLRDCPEHAALPILMMTSLDDDNAIGRAYESGASDFFIKSTHWALLAERIRHLLRMARMQDELTSTNRRLVEAQTVGGVSGYDFDLVSGIVTGSPGSFALFGFHTGLTAAPISQLRVLVDPADLLALELALRAAVIGGVPIETEFLIRTADSGQVRLIRMEGKPVNGRDGRVARIVGVMRDVTARRQAQDEISRMSRVDPMTGLLNRASFLSLVDEAIGAARGGSWSVAVAVADLDRFGHVNERFGQVGGDELLRQLAARLERLFGPDAVGDSQGRPLIRGGQLARLAGDSFAVLLPVISDLSGVDPMLERIHHALREPFALVGGSCVVTASIGVALFPRDGDSAGLLLSRADLATSTVKAQGRGGMHWYSPALDHAGVVKLELADDLRRAIDRNELELFYQPIVDVTTRRLYGVEALMRWRKRTGLVSPVDFIPLAEETGLIIPMGEWALQEACRQLASWREQGLDVGSVAVNLPSSHFERASLLATVTDAIGKYNLPAGSIELELTESALIRDLDRTLPRLNALRDAGVVIAIDDFGTGYSSLAYLTRLPVGKLKIDRSFVREMGSAPQAEAIVRAIVALGKGLDLALVAEGVETEEQARHLASLGCSLMQGFLFARPVPPASLRSVRDAAIEAIRRCGLGTERTDDARTPSRLVVDYKPT